MVNFWLLLYTSGSLSRKNRLSFSPCWLEATRKKCFFSGFLSWGEGLCFLWFCSVWFSGDVLSLDDCCSCAPWFNLLPVFHVTSIAELLCQFLALSFLLLWFWIVFVFKGCSYTRCSFIWQCFVICFSLTLLSYCSCSPIMLTCFHSRTY